jgi:hypothetical protein
MVAVIRGSSSRGLTGGNATASADDIVSPGSVLMENDDREPNMSSRCCLSTFGGKSFGIVARVLGGNVLNSAFLDV